MKIQYRLFKLGPQAAYYVQRSDLKIDLISSSAHRTNPGIERARNIFQTFTPIDTVDRDRVKNLIKISNNTDLMQKKVTEHDQIMRSKSYLACNQVFLKINIGLVPLLL